MTNLHTIKTHQELVGLTDKQLLSISTRVTHQHYKGGLYRILGSALHTETEDSLTVYEHIFPYASKMYVRPSGMFYGEVSPGVPRFREIAKPVGEQEVLIEEWHRAVRDFGLRPGSQVETFLGRVMKRLRGF